MYNGKKVIVLIMAAGIGNRFGAGVPKQYVTVGDEPMVLLTYRAFANNEFVDDIFLVCAEDKMQYCKKIFNDHREKLGKGFDKIKDFICGGETRQESVFLGLDYLNQSYSSNSIVLIHDAARPFVSDELIERVIHSAYCSGSAIPGVPENDTLYKVLLDEAAYSGAADAGAIDDEARNRESNDVDACGDSACGVDSDEKKYGNGLGYYMRKVVDRNEYRRVQTPQGFVMNFIYDAHRAARADGYTGTDDGSLLKWRGKSVTVVEGDPANIKITTQDDLCTTQAAFNNQHELRVGSGFDVHAFADDRKLILGGVEIPYEKGLLGHSDADVLTHALMDAMLGALSLGDIGHHFPDTDEQYKGISSLILLESVLGLISEKGWEIVNVDLTIIAEKPKMKPHISDIIKRLSEVLAIPEDCIGLKATTTEGLGFTGREEGIGSQATVLLMKKEKE